jgi:hypothetical protein
MLYMVNMKKTTAQSMSVSEAEKVVIEVLALAERMKPAAFVREIFYRGIFDYLQDKKVHAPIRNEILYTEINRRIEANNELKRLKEMVAYRLGLIDKRAKEEDWRVQSLPSPWDEEAFERALNQAKEEAGLEESKGLQNVKNKGARTEGAKKPAKKRA